jgi:hypothetical protein
MKGFKEYFWWRKDKQAAAQQLSDFAQRAQEFRDTNPDYLMLLADPKTDVIFMAYGGVMCPVRILDKFGAPQKIVHNFIKHNRGNGDIDRFLLAVDGAGFQIAKGLYTLRRRSLSGKVLRIFTEDEMPAESKVSLEDGSKVSPVQLVDA